MALVAPIALVLTSCLATVHSGGFEVEQAAMEDATATVSASAAFEFKCPNDKLEFVVLDVSSDTSGTQYPKRMRVTGCGHSANYVNSRASGWVMETQTRDETKGG